MNGKTDLELPLGPDFATRVLAAADRLVARRRRIRQMAGASVLCAVLAAAVWLDFSAARQVPAEAPGPQFASLSRPNADREAPSTESDGSPDALSWLFPDARPLARYAAEDAPDNNSANSAGSLFADDE